MESNPGDATPAHVADMLRDLTAPARTAQYEHRHFFLRTREIEWEDSESKVHTEYHYMCFCGERVIP